MAELFVDAEKIARARELARGAAYWLGRALRAAPGKDPLHAVERIAAHPEKLPPLGAAEDEQLREEMRAEARAAVRELKSRIEDRKQRKRALRIGSFEGAPWKYVIVATGNIHYDVEQAR